MKPENFKWLFGLLVSFVLLMSVSFDLYLGRTEERFTGNLVWLETDPFDFYLHMGIEAAFGLGIGLFSLWGILSRESSAE